MSVGFCVKKTMVPLVGAEGPSADFSSAVPEERWDVVLGGVLMRTEAFDWEEVLFAAVDASSMGIVIGVESVAMATVAGSVGGVVLGAAVKNTALGWAVEVEGLAAGADATDITWVAEIGKLLIGVEVTGVFPIIEVSIVAEGAKVIVVVEDV